MQTQEEEGSHQLMAAIDTSIPSPPQAARPRRPRPPRPRKPSLNSLRAQWAALELAVSNLPDALRDLGIVPSPSTLSTRTNNAVAVLTDTSAEDAERMRLFLIRTIRLTTEAHEEIKIRKELHCMLKNHYECSASLRRLLRDLPLDSWHWACERWRALTLEFYEPMAESACRVIVEETLLAINDHTLPEGTMESGGFGWRDWVHLDANRCFVRFTTRKTLHVDMEQIVDHTWSHYTNGDLYRKARFGDKSELFHQVLQRISPDVMIVQRVEKFPDLVQMTHTVAIAFRVPTETGYMIAFRCISSPRLQRLMQAEGLSLCGTFGWDRFEVAHRNAQGECDAVQLTVAGSIGSDNPTYAKKWHDAILAALVRYELQLKDASITETAGVMISSETTS